MITVERAESFKALEDLKTAWKELLAQSDVDVVFLTPEWLEAWWNVFGEDKQLYILVIKADGEVVGIAPLMLSGRGRRGAGKTIEFIGTPNIDYADIIAKDKPEILSHVMRYLDDHKSEWGRIILAQIPQHSASLSFFRELQGSKGRMLVKEIESCYSHVYDGPEEGRSQFSFRKSHTMKSAMNVLQKNGGLNCVRLKEQSDWDKYLPVLFHLHICRWDHTMTPSKFLEEKNRRFYYELLDKLGGKGQICFTLVANGEIPVALSFNFDYKGVINYYTLSINEFYKKRSPGQMLLALQGESFIRQGYQLDYSRGAQSYKNVFANRSSINYEVSLFANKSNYIITDAIDRIKRTKPVAALLKNRSLEFIKLKISIELKNNGFKGLIYKIIMKAGELFQKFIFEYREFFVFRFDGEPDTSIKPRLPVTFQKLDASAAPSLATFYGVSEDSMKHKTIVERFEKGADCFAAVHNGNIVSVYWGLYHTDFHSELNLSLKPESNEVILSDALTSPIYRGMRLVPYLVARTLMEYHKKGIKGVTGVARRNKSSLKVVSLFDFKRTRTIRYLKIIGIRIL